MSGGKTGGGIDQAIWDCGQDGKMALSGDTVGILTVPPEIRKVIYERILGMEWLIPVVFFQDDDGGGACRMAGGWTFKPKHWTAILFVNRQMYAEASDMLYSGNRFYFLDDSRRQDGGLQQFLSGIGMANASTLRYVCINFPGQEVEKAWQASLNVLREKCRSMTTLELFLRDRNAGALTGTASSAYENMIRVDAQMKAISSLKRIVIRDQGRVVTRLGRELMSGLGWSVDAFDTFDTFMENKG